MNELGTVVLRWRFSAVVMWQFYSSFSCMFSSFFSVDNDVARNVYAADNVVVNADVNDSVITN